MRILATKLNSYLCRRKPPIGPPSRNFSSLSSKDELALEEEVERKIGWVLKMFFVGTATFVGYQFFPYLGTQKWLITITNYSVAYISLYQNGDNVMEQSVSLLHVKDPLFKRMGASRLTRFAIDDDRRMKIVEIGGAAELLNMLGAAKDDRTRQEALKALTALSLSDKALGALHHAGAVSVIRATPESAENQEVMKYKTKLLKRFQDSGLQL